MDPAGTCFSGNTGNLSRACLAFFWGDTGNPATRRVFRLSATTVFSGESLICCSAQYPYKRQPPSQVDWPLCNLWGLASFTLCGPTLLPPCLPSSKKLCPVPLPQCPYQSLQLLPKRCAAMRASHFGFWPSVGRALPWRVEAGLRAKGGVAR